MMRPLSEPIPSPVLPPGFIIRPIKGKEEADAVAAMHRAAFGTDYMTTENRLAIMSTSEYDPSLDLLAIAPGGEIAAYCSCSVKEGEKRGLTDPIATHPKYQHMGLARALILKGWNCSRNVGWSPHIWGPVERILPCKKRQQQWDFEWNTKLFGIRRKSNKPDQSHLDVSHGFLEETR